MSKLSLFQCQVWPLVQAQLCVGVRLGTLFFHARFVSKSFHSPPPPSSLPLSLAPPTMRAAGGGFVFPAAPARPVALRKKSASAEARKKAEASLSASLRAVAGARGRGSALPRDDDAAAVAAAYGRLVLPGNASAAATAGKAPVVPRYEPPRGQPALDYGRLGTTHVEVRD